MAGCGFAGSDGEAIPASTFVPEWAMTYNIVPSNKFQIFPGEFTQGQIININVVGNPVEIDFDKLPSDVVVVHTDQGKFVVQK